MLVFKVEYFSSTTLMRLSLSPAVRRDRTADRRPGGDRGAVHPETGRGAEGGASGGSHRGRLGAGQ